MARASARFAVAGAVIDPDILRWYMHTFVGFGTPDAPVWFIGLEQGGGEDLPELERRLAAWQTLGSSETADLLEYCEQIQEARWHGRGAKS
jgi:hypothetical protein